MSDQTGDPHPAGLSQRERRHSSTGGIFLAALRKNLYFSTPLASLMSRDVKTNSSF